MSCLNKALKRFKNNKELSRKMIEELYEELSEIKNNRPADFNKKMNDAIFRKKLQNIQRERARLHEENIVIGFDEFSKQTTSDGKPVFQSPYEALSAYISGSIQQADSGSVSVMLLRSVKQEDYAEHLTSLSDEMFQVLKDAKLDIEVAKHMRGEGTNSKMAKEIAETLKGLEKRMLHDKQEAGLTVLQLEGRVTRQSHDFRKVSLDKQKWKNDIVSLLDMDRTFGEDAGNKAKVSEILDEIIEESENRVPMTEQEELGFVKAGQKHRALFFKDAESEIKYLKEYGKGSIFKSYLDEIEITARQVAVAEKLSQTPVRMFNRLKSRAVKNFNKEIEPEMSKAEEDAFLTDIAEKMGISKNSKEAKAELKGMKAGYLESQFLASIGALETPIDTAAFKVIANTRQISNMAKLGSVMFLQVSEAAIAARALRSMTGENYFGMLGRYAKNLVASIVNRGMRKEVAKSVSVNVMEALRSQQHRLTGEHVQDGAISRMSNLFYKANGLDFMTNVMKDAHVYTAIKHYGSRSDISFRDLSPRERGSLRRAGIFEKEWDVIRQGIEKLPGKEVAITTRGIRSLSDEVFKKYKMDSKSRANLEKIKNDIASKYKLFLLDNAEQGIANPDARTQAFTSFGYPPDSAAGQTIRTMTQLKSFAFQLFNNTRRAALAGGDINSARNFRDLFRGRNGDLQGLMASSVTMMGMAYMMDSVRKIAQGKSPNDPDDLNTWKEAFVQSGVIGLYGDLYFSQHQRYGMSTAEMLAGPTGGALLRSVDILYGLREGRFEPKQAFRLLRVNTPYGNLPYVKPVIDWAFVHSIQEVLSPGYSNRAARWTAREGNEYLDIPINLNDPRNRLRTFE